MKDLYYESICPVCHEATYPGEIHYVCNREKKVSSIHQCVICLTDERQGNHNKCQEKRELLRSKIIQLMMRY